jgi:poly(3-hydroxybutyrate) depolymerase
MRKMNYRFAGPALGLFSMVFLLVLGGRSWAATDVKVEFTLKTTDAAGAAITQNRFYYVYRPDNLARDKPAPLVLCMECRGGDLPAKFFHRKADEAGFVLVSCAIEGNSTGNRVWNNGNPRVSGFEDIDYTTAVIDRVALAEKCNDAFICGLSKGGHMTCAYACERPAKIRAAADVDEFMGLTTNIPTAPLPMIFFHGTRDNAVPYAMMKDTVDAWRATNGLLSVRPVTTYESAPRLPGEVTQTTWAGAAPVAFVTIVGGTHTWPSPRAETGYDITDGMWAFFAQFLTATEHAPRITSKPANSVQYSGHPASFRVAATGDGPLGYQWQKNGTNIPGATSACYTTGPAGKDEDGAIYRVVVSGRLGSLASGGATLTVLAAPAGPTISRQPGDQAVLAGKPVTFVAGATATPGLRFQWQKNGMDIVGATGSSYTIPAALTADCGATFRVVAGDESGRSTSLPATLTVTPAPGAPVIVTNPERNRLPPGAAGTFSVTARSATPMSYQWQQGTLTTNFVDIPGATAARYTTPAATLQDHRTLFRCVVANAAGSATSAGEMLLVTSADNAPQAGPAQPSSGK